jgi:hypothetical protein
MSGGFAFANQVANANSVGALTATSLGTNVTPGSNAYGSWVTISASTPYDCTEIHIRAVLNDTSGGGGLGASENALTIGIGAGGSEVSIVKDILISNLGGYVATGSTTLVLPIAIPAGTRIAAKSASSQSGTTSIYVNIVLLDGCFPNMNNIAGLDSMGFTLSSETGVAVAPSATVNRDYCGLVGIFNFPAGGSWPHFGLMEIGIGGAGSEQIIYPLFILNGTPTRVQYFGGLAIPSGSRLAAKCQSSSASDVSPNLVLYGMYK